MISILIRLRLLRPFLGFLLGNLLLNSFNRQMVWAQMTLSDSVLLQTVSSQLVATEARPDNIPETITVKRFEFVGNTVFSQEQLAEVTKTFINRPISFTQLLQARSAVTQLYVQAGYSTSGAYIPEQTIENGVVKIEIVEGGLETIEVKVEGRLNPNYIRDHLAIATGTPLNVPHLLEALQLLQLDPLIRSISAELSASPQPGLSILNVAVVSAPSFNAQVLLDNGRSPLVGSFRRGVQIGEDNLSGNGDRLQGFYYNTDGSDDWNVSYNVPVNAYNGKLNLEYRNLTSKIIEPPFNVLDIQGDYDRYLVSLRQPIMRTPTEELALGLTFDRQESSTRLLEGLPLPTASSDAEGRIKISTLRFFQEWVKRSEQEVLAARSEFSLGVDWFGVTTPFDTSFNPNAPENNYFTWRGQAQWARLLAPNTLFLTRVEMQAADSPLVSLEQFALGGLGSVQGYRQNTLLTDNGLFAAMELRLPIVSVAQSATLVQIIPFVNFGTGWNVRGANPPVDTLASVGLGLQWQQGENLSVRIDWAHRLGRVPYLSGNTWQDDGILFTIILKPF